MAGEEQGQNPQAGGGNGQDQPPVVSNVQYTKDLSFEVPGAPEIFAKAQQTQPNINVNIDVRASQLQANVFEVVLQVNSECKIGDATAFLVELAYGGVFTLNVPPEHVQAVVLIECPRLLFPFARAIIADVTREGGFPPLIMGPVDFLGMYQQRLAEASAAAGQGGGSTPPAPEADA
ncbi:MAG: protein-export chaperone SecB [Hyphomicrobiales bacterium]|nr:protein-export chaperone SecB [Hyphomicrobiales bacterium]